MCYVWYRRTAQLYDHLIGRGQQAVRCCPSEGGDVVWIDLGSLRHTFPNDNNHTQVEQVTRTSLKFPVKYLRTTDNGLTFWANTDDINTNEKFRVIYAESGGSVHHVFFVGLRRPIRAKNPLICRPK